MSSMSLQGIQAAPAFPAVRAQEAVSEPIIDLHVQGRIGVPALNSFYALLAYGLYCHRTKQESRLPPERIGQIIEELKRDPKFPQTIEELNAVIYRSSKTSEGKCHIFDQILLQDGESFPFKVKFISSTIDVSELEGDFGLGVPNRVVKAYQGCKEKLDPDNDLPLTWGKETLRRIHLIYAYLFFETGGRTNTLIHRTCADIHEILKDLESNKPGFLPLHDAKDETRSNFAKEIQKSGNSEVSGIYYDHFKGVPLKFSVNEKDGHLSLASQESLVQANEILAAYAQPEKEVSQEFPLSKETLSFLNAIHACYILAYFIRNQKKFLQQAIKKVPEELPRMKAAIQKPPSLDDDWFRDSKRQDKRVNCLNTCEEFLEAFKKEAVFKNGAWVIDKIGTIELNLRIKDNVLYTDEFDKKYGYGAALRTLKQYEVIADKMDGNNDSSIPEPQLPSGAAAPASPQVARSSSSFDGERKQ